MKNSAWLLAAGVLAFSGCGGGGSRSGNQAQFSPPPLNEAQKTQFFQTLQSATALLQGSSAQVQAHGPSPSTGGPPPTPPNVSTLTPNEQKFVNQIAAANCDVNVDPGSYPNPQPSPNGPAVSATQTTSVGGALCPISMSDQVTVTSQATQDASMNTSTTTTTVDSSSVSVKSPALVGLNDVTSYTISGKNTQQSSGAAASSGSTGGSFNSQGSLQSQQLGTIPFTQSGSFSFSIGTPSLTFQTQATLTFQFPGFTAQLVETESNGDDPSSAKMSYTLNGEPLDQTVIRNYFAH